MDLTEILQEINAEIRLRESSLAIRRAYAEGDHWQSSKGYAGIVGTSKDNEGALVIQDAILGSITNFFTPKGMFRDVCLNVRDAVMGKEPYWSFYEGDNENQELIDIFTRYVDRLNLLRPYQDAAFYLPWALIQDTATTKAAKARQKLTVSPLRLYLPKKYIVDGRVPTEDFETSLFKLRIASCSPEYAGVIYDDDDEPYAGFYVYSLKDENNKTANEVEISINRPDDLLLEQIKEKLISSEPVDNPTYIFKVREDLVAENCNPIIEAAAYPMQGRLHIHEMRALPTVTDDMLRVQRSTDAGRTSLAINNSYNVPERIAENAKPPGYFSANGQTYLEWSMIPEADKPGATFVYGTLETGPGVTAFIKGMETFDSEGNPTGYTTPRYRRDGPFDAKPTIEGTDAFVHDFYHQARQLHTLAGVSANASAELQVQLTTTFLASVKPHQYALESAWRWGLEGLRNLASHFSNEKQYLEARASVRISPLTSMPTSDDKRVMVDAAKNKVLSKETVQEKGFDIVDVDAEKVRLEEEGRLETNSQTTQDISSSNQP